MNDYLKVLQHIKRQLFEQFGSQFTLNIKCNVLLTAKWTNPRTAARHLGHSPVTVEIEVGETDVWVGLAYSDPDLPQGIDMETARALDQRRSRSVPFQYSDPDLFDAVVADVVSIFGMFGLHPLYDD